MMVDAECIHGLDPSWCSICLHGVSRPAPVTVEYLFRAKRDGQCPECDLPICAGERIARLSNGHYVHESCIPEAQ